VSQVRRRVLRLQAPVLVPPLEPVEARLLVAPEIKQSDSCIETADIFAGRVFTLNENNERLLRSEDETSGLYSGDVRNGDICCDVRALWEPARLQHLTILLAKLAGRERSAADNKMEEFVRSTLLGWLDKNPFLTGPHYMSAMECGLRVPVFFLALKYVEGLTQEENARILEAMYRHAWWIERRLSLYSSLGNHTVCECVGLVFAGAVYRQTEEGRRWLEKGIRLLRQELDHQVLPDGGPVEQSFSYHRFVLDLYWLAVDFMESNNIRDCSDFKVRLTAGEEFLNAFKDEEGQVPAIGDSDDGFALAPGLAPKRNESSFRAPPLRTFQSSGYTVMRGKNGALLTFDHGPLGMAPLYNHGHADALSITLTVRGQKILVDPGTYRYNGEPEFRRYFKGTSAHNTVTIDGRDQATQVTGFIWADPYESRLVRSEEWEGYVIVEAENDGYLRLPGNLKHRRAVAMLDDGNFIIRDTFSGSGAHDFALHFHINPDAHVGKHGEWWKITIGSENVYIKTIGPSEFSLAMGERNPLLGWYSPAYGVLQKSSVLWASARGRPEEVSFTSLICLGGITRQKRLEEVLWQLQ